MIPRLINLPKDESLLLFGARGTGKTTLLKNLPDFENALIINLLKADVERQLRNNPDALYDIVKAMPASQHHLVVDEVQKVPKLLDIVHDMIEDSTIDKKFILTGSSARKLKRGGANLLAGRAFVYHLFPFNYLEIADHFILSENLRWGMLPKIFEYDSAEKRQRFLDAYTNTYLKEEVWGEHEVRQLDPFRHFLEVAAQINGKQVNYANIARDVGVSNNTISEYFTILEDTLLGFYLNAFQHSFRKRLSKTPKFYFFDTGVVRALRGRLSVSVNEQTSAYGEIFEHFVILQCKQLTSYTNNEYRFSYLATKDGAEIDLVVERPGNKILFIEIKSSKDVQPHHLTSLKILARDFGDCEAVCFSRDNFVKQIDGITVYPWHIGVKQFFMTI